jgi:hypothetical protein
MDYGAIFDCADGGTARQEVHHRHLPEAVAVLQDSEEELLSAPGFQHRDFARFEDEHRIGLVVFTEKELVRRDGHHRAQVEQEPEDVGPDSAEDWHALQEFDPRYLHGNTSGAATMICGGPVRKEECWIDRDHARSPSQF